MALDFIITVDTEADNQWQEAAPLTVDNLNFLPRFQDLCEKYGFVPTYLLTYEAAASTQFTSWLKAKLAAGLADAGAHLHPWSNPPWERDEEKTIKTFPNELPVPLLKAKLTSLTTALQENIDFKPRAFRAGRWGVSQTVIKAIKDLGYEVDSSVTPLINWPRVVPGSPTLMNFSHYPLGPYNWHGIIEIPMTVVPVPRWKVTLPPHGNKLFYRKVWGRFFPETTVPEVWQAFLEADRLGLPFFQFMIHSSELMPGGSIYNKTPASVERLYGKLENFFERLAAAGILGLSLTLAGKKGKELIN